MVFSMVFPNKFNLFRQDRTSHCWDLTITAPRGARGCWSRYPATAERKSPWLSHLNSYTHRHVVWKGGTPKSSILMEFSTINQLFGCTTISGNLHLTVCNVCNCLYSAKIFCAMLERFRTASYSLRVHFFITWKYHMCWCHSDEKVATMFGSCWHTSSWAEHPRIFAVPSREVCYNLFIEGSLEVNFRQNGQMRNHRWEASEKRREEEIRSEKRKDQKKKWMNR